MKLPQLEKLTKKQREQALSVYTHLMVNKHEPNLVAGNDYFMTISHNDEQEPTTKVFVTFYSEDGNLKQKTTKNLEE